MSTGVIIAIVAVAIVLVAVISVVIKKRQKQLKNEKSVLPEIIRVMAAVKNKRAITLIGFESNLLVVISIPFLFFPFQYVTDTIITKHH